MVKEYLQRNDLAREDLRHLLEAGDKVWVKQRIPGKLQARAEGPCVFLKYTGDNHLGAEVMDTRGQLREVAVANLLPYRGSPEEAAPTRVWDLPAELASSEPGEAAAAGWAGFQPRGAEVS